MVTEEDVLEFKLTLRQECQTETGLHQFLHCFDGIYRCLVCGSITV